MRGWHAGPCALRVRASGKKGDWTSAALSSFGPIAGAGKVQSPFFPDAPSMQQVNLKLGPVCCRYRLRGLIRICRPG